MVQPMPPKGNPTKEQRLIHELGNSLSAARLRLDMVLSDPQCGDAFRTNLSALGAALDGARRLADEIEESVWGEGSRPPLVEGDQGSSDR